MHPIKWHVQNFLIVMAFYVIVAAIIVFVF